MDEVLGKAGIRGKIEVGEAGDYVFFEGRLGIGALHLELAGRGGDFFAEPGFSVEFSCHEGFSVVAAVEIVKLVATDFFALFHEEIVFEGFKFNIAKADKFFFFLETSGEDSKHLKVHEATALCKDWRTRHAKAAN